MKVEVKANQAFYIRLTLCHIPRIRRTLTFSFIITHNVTMW